MSFLHKWFQRVREDARLSDFGVDQIIERSDTQAELLLALEVRDRRAQERSPDSGVSAPVDMKIINEFKVPGALAPCWKQNAEAALKALTKYCDRHPKIDDKLGALGVLASVLLAYGDSLQAHQLNKITAPVSGSS